MIKPIFKDEPAIILGTGPSLRDQMMQIKQSKARIFGLNNTYLDFECDVFTACNIEWWDTYGADFRQKCPDTPAYHWDKNTCKRFNLTYIQGTWEHAKFTDPNYLYYGHCSLIHAMGLAHHYGCNPIFLAGADMDYPKSQPRHYYWDLSDKEGEYPEHLRKFSSFDGLLKTFDKLAAVEGLPTIYNTVDSSRLRCFPFHPLPQ